VNSATGSKLANTGAALQLVYADTEVPEPGTVVLGGLGLLGFVTCRFRTKRFGSGSL
jgi:hypothetical protein